MYVVIELRCLAARFAMIIVLLLFGTMLSAGCKAEKPVSGTTTPNQQPQNFSFTGIGDLPGRALHRMAFEVSADGRIIVGNGTNPSGQTEGWVVALR